MKHNNTLERVLRRSLAGLACAWACTNGCAAEAGHVQIDLALASDGVLELAYTLPPGITELNFLDGGAGHVVFRGKHLQPATPCARLEAKRMLLLDEPGCGSVMRWRVQPLLLNAYRQYEAAQPLSDGTLLADTGYYAAVAPGHGLRWVLHSPANGYVIGQGGVVQGEVSLAATTEQVQTALDQPGTDEPLAVAFHHYVLLGMAPTERLGQVTLVSDPALDAGRAQQIRQTLGEAVMRLTKAYGEAPSTPPMVVASVADVNGWHGDTTAGNTMRLRLPRLADAVSASRLDRFVTHEAVHWWNAGIYRTDHSKPWLHEGHADWASLLLLREAGKLDAEAVASQVQTSLNRCVIVRGETPASQLTPSMRDDSYACGLTLMMLAQALHAQRSTDPTSQGLHMLASLHLGTSSLDQQRLIAWADGTAQGGTLHTLLTDESVGFTSGLQQTLAILKLADAPLLRDVPAPFPSEASALLARTLMQALMARDCGGSADFWTLPDRIRIGMRATCQNLRIGQDVLSVNGTPMFPNTLAAWNGAQQSCQTGKELSLAYADGSYSLQPCPAQWPVLPITQWITLRPDALARMGLKRQP